MHRDHEEHKLAGEEFDPDCEICLYNGLRADPVANNFFLRRAPKINNRGLIALKGRCVDANKKDV